MKFSRVFPTPKTHDYFMFMDSLGYHDKLLDAFETRLVQKVSFYLGFNLPGLTKKCCRFSDNIHEGIEYIESYCRNNAHI